MLPWQFKCLQITAATSDTQTLQIPRGCNHLVGFFIFSSGIFFKCDTPLKTSWPFQNPLEAVIHSRETLLSTTSHRPLFYNLQSSLSGNSQQVLSGNQSLSWATSLITIPGEETWKTDLCATVANLLSKGAPVSAEDHHTLTTSHYQHNTIANWNSIRKRNKIQIKWQR